MVVVDKSSAGYKYFIVARIKKESSAMKGLILSTPPEPGVFNDIPYGNGNCLIDCYSEERARGRMSTTGMRV